MDVPIYTPILVHYVDSVKLSGVSPGSAEANLRLEITAPSSNLPGYYQSYQRTWVVPVPASGVLQLELLPSRYLHTPRHYRVKLYRLGNTMPEAVQSWEVPDVYVYDGLDVVRSISEPFDVLPNYVFGGVQVFGYTDWRLEPGRIIWDGSGAPPAGTAYSLSYIRPYGLGDIVRPE